MRIETARLVLENRFIFKLLSGNWLLIFIRIAEGDHRLDKELARKTEQLFDAIL